jgi:hypothetical protein
MNLETFKKIFAQEFEKFQQERNQGEESFDDTIDETLPTPMGCSPIHYVWETQHMFEVPDGYSALIT